MPKKIRTDLPLLIEEYASAKSALNYQDAEGCGDMEDEIKDYNTALMNLNIWLTTHGYREI
jgi:hypothetical protein